MSSNKILLITGASFLLLVLAGRYGALSEAPSASGSVNDLPHAKQTPSQNAQDVQPDIPTDPVKGDVQHTLSAQDLKKLELFKAVIESGKDNDPRVDKELKDLSPALKNALREEYQKLPKEHRNGRGFIAFLIGRSLADISDVTFLEQVVNEEPCLSFKDCSTPGPMYEEAEEHSTNVTLNYPQIVASRMLKQNLAKAPAELRPRINQAITTSRF